jgi:GxxExxY protein
MGGNVSHHKGTENTKERANYLSQQVIGAANEVHRMLGPGLLESVYEECLCREIFLRGIAFDRQIPLPVEYKGIHLDCGYRLDLVIDNLVIIELKSVEKLEPVHEAQLMTYLTLRHLWLGLLINFNVSLLKLGIRRIVMG